MNTKLIIKSLLLVLTIILIYRLFFNETIENFRNIDEVRNRRIRNLLDLVKTSKYTNEPIWSNELQSTDQKVSFWNPNLQSYTYNIGSSVSNGISSPNTEMTLVGGDIKYPTQFEKIISMGTGRFSSSTNLENELNDINTRIPNLNRRMNQYIVSNQVKEVKLGTNIFNLRNPYVNRKISNISSIEVPNGLQVTIYEKANKGGSSITLGESSGSNS